MKLLVLNAGSSSQKACLYELQSALPTEAPQPLWEAQLDWRSDHDADMSVQTKSGQELQSVLTAVTRREALAQLLSTLWSGCTQVLPDPQAIDAVGHRVVHGGEQYQASVVITPDVKRAIADLSVLAPAHNPVNLEGIELAEQLLGEVPQVAVFDTAFHSQMPDVAYTYPGDYDWLQQGIRRYGFHGISHQYCAQRVAELLGRELATLRLIVCHLGNGCSLAAIREGHSVDTTMGFTPLEGLMMGSRSGSIDPGLLIYLLQQGTSLEELNQLLNHNAGLKGISGVSHDWRDIEAAIAQGNPRAKLAQGIYLHRLKAAIGAMLMSLGGLDALVFTAGVGEHSAMLRASVCDALAFLGVELDASRNQQNPVDQDIATAGSAVRVFVIHTQEDWAIAQACWRCLQKPT